MKRIAFLASLILFPILSGLKAQSSFELRYFMPESRANGETDFKGETEVFTTEQRVDFLKQYADVASRQFRDTLFNTVVVTDEEITETVNAIKPLPAPEVRRHLELSGWKYLGYRKGQHQESTNRLERWTTLAGVELQEGKLTISSQAEPLVWDFPPQAWRFNISWEVRPTSIDQEVKFILSDKQLINAATVGFGPEGKIFYTTAQGEYKEAMAYQPGQWYHFYMEIDLSGLEGEIGRYNLYVNNQLVADYVPIERAILGKTPFSSIGQVNTFAIKSNQQITIDNLLGTGYALTNRPRYPYAPETIVDETFDIKPDIEGWTKLSYDDSLWAEGSLPLAHGSQRFALEDLYLRKQLQLKDFEQVFMNIETVDPGGEIWVNGQKVLAVGNRYPRRVEISPYLIPNAENLIAVKVNHFYLTQETGELMVHSSLDLSVGWFAGRMSLDFVSPTHIESGYLHTLPIKGENASLKTKILLRSAGHFEGKAHIELFPWFPEESGNPVAKKSIELSFTDSIQIDDQIIVKNPKLWTPGQPTLYKLKITLSDNKGKALDDYVTTTEIRTVDQQGGTFRLNGKPSMLNGGQIMGFRSPLEESVTWNRCPPVEWLVKELLMVKKMNGNLLRIHVHAWESSVSEGINDPRIAELSDQLGVMLIWTTPSWIRTGWDWRQIDFHGITHYINQVYNHSSIVIWEASNHPKSFKDKDLKDSDEFCETVYNTIYPVDSSRLISFSSHIKHMHYGNDAGTIDYNGNPIRATWAYTAPMVTRGNQDSPTGYSYDWSVLRNWESEYVKDMLNSPERAYFNFEHQESMAQPNWELIKGKPYYRMNSYEWHYDEGTIGRRLSFDEWKESQAWQAFSAWEAIKKMRMLDYDGFSWCTLHGGANSGTYQKPLIDMLGHAKLAYWTNKMAFQPTTAGSSNVDIVYGPDDELTPVILHWGEAKKVSLTVNIRTPEGTLIMKKDFPDILLPAGRKSVKLPSFRPSWTEEGYYMIEYLLK